MIPHIFVNVRDRLIGGCNTKKGDVGDAEETKQ
jgi:hypothetical protein